MGDVILYRIFDVFDGRELKLALAYDEDYVEPEIDVDPETGEVI